MSIPKSIVQVLIVSNNMIVVFKLSSYLPKIHKDYN